MWSESEKVHNAPRLCTSVFSDSNMSFKKTDLVKNLGLKISEKMKKAGVPERFGVASTALPDRREQRRLDQLAGLIPFAIKLNADLVKQLQDRAVQEGVTLNEWVDRLIRAGLAVQPAAKAVAVKTEAPAPAKKAATPVVKPVVAKKPVASKTATAPAPAKKEAAKKVAAKKVAAQKVAVKTAAKPAAKTAPKPVAKKAPAKKAAAKKATAKKATAKKS